MLVHEVCSDPATKFPVKTFVSRKAHTKSRGGCTSCKRRRQKCDEAKPHCTRCQRLGFDCEYSKPTNRLRVASDTSTSTNSSDASSTASSVQSPSSQELMVSSETSVFQSILSPTTYTCSARPLVDLVFRDVMKLPSTFKTQSISENLHCWLTTGFVKFTAFGDVATQLFYRKESIRMAMTRPYLMHVLMALASLQHRKMHHPESPIPGLEETTYWQRGLKLFHKRLTTPANANDADALLATSAFINGCSFAFITTMDPAESWPNKVRPDALGWLRVLPGPLLFLKSLKELFKDGDSEYSAVHVSQCLLEDKTFRQPGINGIPRSFVELFELTPESDMTNHPYHAMVRVVAPFLDLLGEKQRVPDAAIYFAFMGNVTPEFTELLHQRDERALLLLCYWYAMLHAYDIWWSSTRATIESRAICMYLETSKDHRIRELLEYPARKCDFKLMSQVPLEEGPMAMALPDQCTTM